ncbi:unnamed protein product [Arctogadus glacialis]
MGRCGQLSAIPPVSFEGWVTPDPWKAAVNGVLREQGESSATDGLSPTSFNYRPTAKLSVWWSSLLENYPECNRRGSGTVAEGDEDEDVLAVVFTWPWQCSIGSQLLASSRETSSLKPGRDGACTTGLF